MGLRRDRRFRSEPLERRALLAIEPASIAVPIGPTANLSVASASISSAASGAAAGRSVIAYSDRDDATGKGRDVYVRRFERDGRPLAAAAIVNVTTANAQMNPDVATNASGAYAVVWQSENQDGSGWGVYARAYAASGAASGEVLVNQTTAGAQVSPRVAIDADGAFVVAWVGRDDNAGNGIVYARRFNPDGTAATNEVALSTNGNLAHTAPDVALAGDAVGVAWVTSDIANAGQTDVSLRRLDRATLAPLAATATVNPATGGDQAEPAVAALGETGDLVVVWSDTGGGGSEATIVARRVDAAGVDAFAPVQISQDSDGNRNRPHVASAGQTTVIGWTQQIVGATDASAATRAYTGALVAASNEQFATDGVSARTLYGVGVTGPGAFREVSTLGEFAGHGTAATGAFANVLQLDGTAGNDQVVAYDLDAGTIRATINGASADYVRGAYDHLRVELGAGNDRLIADDASLWATVGGGAGDDSILGTSANDSISGGDGNDRVEAGLGSDYAIGNGGNDVALGQDGDDTLTGGAGKDTMFGGLGADRLSGSGSPDVLQGEEGDDRVYGDDGDDRVDGGGGRDRTYGGAGNDLLVGGSSNDRMYGDAGNDTLNGGKGNDYLEGGADTDLVSGREPGDTLISIEAP